MVNVMADKWKAAAWRRRLALLVLIVTPCLLTGRYMPEILPQHGGNALEIGIIIISCILMGWISLGFWTAIFGFFTLIKGANRFSPSAADDGGDHISSQTKTAVLMPICNEDVNRVMAGLQVIYESLQNTGRLENYDFYLLSDSSDPDVLVEEEVAWAALCGRLNAFGRVFYRHRKVNLKRKSGNVADFCRRHGRQYKYMIVLDADSIMAGQTLVRMVRIMEQRPECGLLQTLPLSVNRETPLALVQQFASQAYGLMFSAGLHYWLLGDSLYWGHNAIIRTAAFMAHCGLPRLSGKPPLGGDIMSHDFVESALLCRNGWEVWLAYDLEGSYEETPPTIMDELKRDRRWCQGNLQHLRLALAGDFHPMQRILFGIGAMSYISAPLWLLLLFMGTAEAIITAVVGPIYFPAERCLFPVWPIWSSGWAHTLLATTGILLFLPKVFVMWLLCVHHKKAHLFGGVFRLILSIVIEIGFSTMLAPIRLLFHSRFVIDILLGRQAGWKSQQRGDREVSWGEALRFNSLGMVLALAWGITLFLINRPFLYWMLVFLISLLAAPVLTVWSSRIGLGRALKDRSLLATPSEKMPSWELIRLQAILADLENSHAQSRARFGQGFVRAVVDPLAHALHCGLLHGPRRLAPQIRLRYRSMCEKCLAQGPESLSVKEKKAILGDRESLEDLHRAVWTLSDQKLAAQWKVAA